MSVGAVAGRPKSQTKLVFFVVFGLVTVFVTYMKNQGFFDPISPTAQHYKPALQILLIHGFFGALALLLGVFQLSNRLRARYLGLHRVLGYVYAVSAFIAAPFAVLVAMKIDSLSLAAATTVQSIGWVVTIAIALYCVRNGNISSTAAG
jgi:hypothetical protein